MTSQIENNANQHETVSIHFGKVKKESPNPTTGQALYILGGIDSNTWDLFRELHDKGDDELIPNDTTVIHLKNGDHFYSSQKQLNPGSLGC
jgi:hypothetical protein